MDLTRSSPAGAGRPWARVLLHRAAQALVVALVVAVVSFAMLQSLPGDQAFRVAAGRYGYDLVDAAAAEAVRAELGLDRPTLQRLGAWLADLARGDLGRSLVSGKPVWHEALHELQGTLQLAAAAGALSLLLGLPVGVAAGLAPGGRVDRASLAAAVVLRALPPFVLALLLVIVFAVQLGALPAAGSGHGGHLVLPACTLALGLAALQARVARDALVAVRQSAWWAYARHKGLAERQVLLRHGLRNAALPLVALFGTQAVALVEGVVIVETLFAWPGVGHGLVHAIFGRDVPMLQATALLLGLVFVGLNTAVDLAVLALDPRRRGRA
ncbi:MAG: hypothetical protein RJA10_1173 [Pseudomonadota bacterium]|jgi:peptide/nickel transport system permease protein